jgi:hypothetical protein
MNETSLHGKIVRHNGSVFKLSSYQFGRSTLISATGTFGPEKGKVYDLNCAHPDRSKTALALKSAVKMGLVS